MREGNNEGQKGFNKIKSRCSEAGKAGFHYVWIDTCCIDTTSSAELSEAINSMYRWDQQAEICFASLSDVVSAYDLAGSVWFTRGWTLQELIAPATVKFYNYHWQFIGTKHGLQKQIGATAGIPLRASRGASPGTCSVARRMSWASHRTTRRKEDIAYCLMGLFDVNTCPCFMANGQKQRGSHLNALATHLL